MIDETCKIQIIPLSVFKKVLIIGNFQGLKVSGCKPNSEIRENYIPQKLQRIRYFNYLANTAGF